MDERIIAAVSKYAQLPMENFEILRELKLIDYGLDSLNTINLILDLEEAFDVQFPDELLIFENLATLKKIQETIEQLQVTKHV